MTTEGQLTLPVIPGPALVAGPVFLCFECPPLPRKAKRVDGVLIPAGPPIVPFSKRHRTRIMWVKSHKPPFAKVPTAHEYDDPESASWKETIGEIAEQHMAGRPPSAREIALLIHAFRPIPESWSRRDKELALAGGIRPTSKPDDDNYLKLRDALNGIVWIDDSQCVDSRVLKFYSDTPALRIEVRELLPPSDLPRPK